MSWRGGGWPEGGDGTIRCFLNDDVIILRPCRIESFFGDGWFRLCQLLLGGGGGGWPEEMTLFNRG